jgi:hypothetical protein
VTSPAYLERRGTAKAPSDISAHGIIAFESPDATNEWRFGSAGKLVRVEPRLTVNSADAAIVAAEAGLGISRTLSYQVIASVLAGRLVPLLVSFTAEKLPVSAIFPRIASQNLSALIKQCREYFIAEPLIPIEEWVIPARRDGISKKERLCRIHLVAHVGAYLLCGPHGTCIGPSKQPISQSVNECPHPRRHLRAGWENGPYPYLERLDISEDNTLQFSAPDLLVHIPVGQHGDSDARDAGGPNRVDGAG